MIATSRFPTLLVFVLAQVSLVAADQSTTGNTPQNLLVSARCFLADERFAMGASALPMVVNIVNNSTEEVRGRVYYQVANPVDLLFPSGTIEAQLPSARDIDSFRSDVLVIPPSGSQSTSISLSRFYKFTGEGRVIFEIRAIFTTESTAAVEGTDVPLHATGEFTLKKNDDRLLEARLDQLTTIFFDAHDAPAQTKRRLADEICSTSIPALYRVLPRLIAHREAKQQAVSAGMQWRNIPDIKILRDAFKNACLQSDDVDVIEATFMACLVNHDLIDKATLQKLIASPSPAIQLVTAQHIEQVMRNLPLSNLASLGRESPGMAGLFNRIHAQMGDPLPHALPQPPLRLPQPAPSGAQDPAPKRTQEAVLPPKDANGF